MCSKAVLVSNITCNDKSWETIFRVAEGIHQYSCRVYMAYEAVFEADAVQQEGRETV